MVLVPIALTIVVVDLVQFIEWVSPSCIYTDVVLNGIINKIHCSMICVKKAINSIDVYIITSI